MTEPFYDPPKKEFKQEGTGVTVYSAQSGIERQRLIVRKEIVEQMLTLAEQAVSEGKFPYVALLEYQGEVIASAVNSIDLPTSKADLPIFEPPNAHPELNLVNKAVEIAEETFPDNHDLQLNFLRDITIYANCEPCSMCALALAGAHVSKIVFSISNNAASKASGIEATPLTSTEQIFKNFGLEAQIVGPIEEERALITFTSAWKQVRDVIFGKE